LALKISTGEMKTFRRHFDKLLAEVPPTPSVGDRVVVAAGLLGMGHPWVRVEGVVVECASTSYKVEFPSREYNGSVPCEWVHQSLITDVLVAASEQREGVE
jgi:hypothetical protein